MLLKMKYAKKEDIPAGYEKLYTENAAGEWVCTEIEGIKSNDDVEAVKAILTKERNEHKATKAKFAPLANMDIDDVLGKVDRIAELEAAAGGKLDETKIEEIVNARMQTKLNPLTRELETLRAEKADLEGKVTNLSKAAKAAKIRSELRKAIEKGKINEAQRADALTIGFPDFELDDDGHVYTTDTSAMGAGFTPDQWIVRQQTQRPYWFGKTTSGNLGGSGGGSDFAGQPNPWSKKHWNRTQQGIMIRDNREMAEQMAAAVGSKIGATTPPEK